MALSANSQPIYEIGDTNEAPLAVGAHAYLGSALGYTGNDTVRPLVAADKFAGFSIDEYDQTSGQVNARFKDKGSVVLTVAGLAANTPIGTAVYASDDNTFTLTSTGNSLVGKIRRIESATKAVVYFNAAIV